LPVQVPCRPCLASSLLQSSLGESWNLGVYPSLPYLSVSCRCPAAADRVGQQQPKSHNTAAGLERQADRLLPRTHSSTILSSQHSSTAEYEQYNSGCHCFFLQRHCRGYDRAHISQQPNTSIRTTQPVSSSRAAFGGRASKQQLSTSLACPRRGGDLQWVPAGVGFSRAH
jgi:hypothetical protein